MTTAPTTEQDFVARMNRLGVTQSFLAGYVGLSQSTISKAVNDLTDSQRTKINEALRELEGIVVFFAPMKLAFEDASAVKAWLASPSLPNLFKLLTDARVLQLGGRDLTVAQEIIRKSNEDCARMEAETAKIQEESQRLFLEWLSESHASGR